MKLSGFRRRYSRAAHARCSRQWFIPEQFRTGGYCPEFFARHPAFYARSFATHQPGGPE